MLCAAVSAQTIRSANDPRNQSPSVGTGGPEGGPTGLFTIYDGSTLRRGEFTFSIAYSNYDRDPGNVDFTDVPLSFNVGLNDHLEIFFKTNGWRGIKVNNPLNLSSFRLPNSQLFCGAVLCSGSAIVLSPSGPNVGTLANTAVFRPLNNQPFVQFPFVGGSAGTFGLTPGQIGQQFGFPGFNALLGPPVVQPNSGTFGSADNFPGIGSPVGGILPGIVLATTVLPATQLERCLSKFRLRSLLRRRTCRMRRLSIACSARAALTTSWWAPKCALRGRTIRWAWASSGSIAGIRIRPMTSQALIKCSAAPVPVEISVTLVVLLFVDGRLGKHVNVSANIGYFLNSNPEGPR